MTQRGRAVPETTAAAAGTTFVRRHPILAGFGVLAGLSLFAAYFPLSAVVTAVVVGVHATGVDRWGLRTARSAGTAILRRWRSRHQTPPAPQPTAPDVRQRTQHVQRSSPDVRGPATNLDNPALRSRDGLPRRRHAVRPPAAAGVERDVEL